MSRITTFLKGLIRRAKEVKGQIYLGLGIAAFSFSLYCVIAEPTKYIIWGALAVFAIGWIIAAYLYADKKERTERAIREVERGLDQTTRMESNRLLSNILEELKKPNQRKDMPKND
jgi:uncharacterized membrane protein YciS (DUF1049 family)